MVHDQLVTAVEQVEQRQAAVQALEGVVLLDADHRQLAPLGGELVERARGSLLLDQQAGAIGLPLGLRDDNRQFHSRPPCDVNE